MRTCLVSSALAATLVVSGSTFAGNWGRHGGGNIAMQEMGDAVYRTLEEDGPPHDYHAGLFDGFSMREFNNGVTGKHPSVAITEINLGSASTGGTVIEERFGKRFYKWVKRRPGVVNHFRLGFDAGSTPHTKQNMDDLIKAFRQIWGNRANVEYRGAFTACTESNGVFTPIANAAKRAQIVMETDRLRQYDGDNRWNYELANMVNYKWYLRCPSWYSCWWYSYFRDLKDVEDARCDFVVEWAYEKSGVMVWGNQSDWRANIAGGSTDNAAYHNNIQGENDCYNLGEVSPQVQSGDFWTNNDGFGCPYDGKRDARSRTTMRPSPAQAPMGAVLNGSWPQPDRLVAVDKASERVYYSLILRDHTGNFAKYARALDGTPYSYRELYLSNESGSYRYQYADLDIDKYHALGYDCVLVVTDQGGNTTEAGFQLW